MWPPTEDEAEVAAPKGARLLRALGRRLARAHLSDEDCRSSSTDSSRSRSSPDSVSPDHNGELSCSSSETGSDDSPEHRRSRSAKASFRRVFQSLSISRSHSCANGDDKATSRSNKKNPQPKKILRPPVTYTYVRGLSGLPTQRVPLSRSGNRRLVLDRYNN